MIKKVQGRSGAGDYDLGTFKAINRDQRVMRDGLESRVLNVNGYLIKGSIDSDVHFVHHDSKKRQSKIAEEY